MSPRAQRWTLGTFIAALTAVGLVVGAAKPSLVYIDGRYVKQHAFDSIRTLRASQRTIDSLQHDREIHEIRSTMARMDTNVTCLRHPKKPSCL